MRENPYTFIIYSKKYQEIKRKHMNNPHENLIDPFALIEKLPYLKKRSIFISKCAYSPNPAQISRIKIYSINEDKLKQLADCWITTSDIQIILDKINQKINTYFGYNDAMYATEPQYLWFLTSSIFKIWRKKKLFYTIFPDQIIFERKKDIIIQSKNISYIKCFLSSDWFKKGIELHLFDGTSIKIVEKKEMATLIDSTYDGLDLMADSFWVTHLGRQLSNFINKDLILNDSLK